MSYSLPLASLILGVVDGMGAGVTNVKSVLYRSCFQAEIGEIADALLRMIYLYDLLCSYI